VDMPTDPVQQSGTGRRSRAERWADHPAAPLLLALFAVAEATVFPTPTEALLIALVVVRPQRVGRLVALTALASAAGAMVGYALGASAWEWTGGPLLERLGEPDALRRVGELYRDNLALALVTSGYTPIPFLVYTLAAGLFRVPLLPFLAFALVGRGVKYLVLALLALGMGPALRAALRRHGPRVVLLAAALLLALWLLAW
jgi:membrane protein YqaA with SNARE-associated domain